MAEQIVDDLGQTKAFERARHQNRSVVDGVFLLRRRETHLNLLLVGHNKTQRHPKRKRECSGYLRA